MGKMEMVVWILKIIKITILIKHGGFDGTKKISEIK